MRRISVEERRARLGRRHHLAPETRRDSVDEVARGLIGLHATDPSTVYLSALARVREATVDDVARALYDDRTVLRMLGMRRTLFVVPVDLVGVVQSACTDAIAAVERKRLLKMLDDAGVGDGRWLRRVEKATLAALHERGSATAAQLSKDVPRLREKISFGEGKKWGGEFGVSGRVLSLLAAEGHIVRGRPRGSIVSSQYEWTTTADWLGAEPEAPPAEEARVDLVRRWLRAFGPATAADIKWWTGWTVGQTQATLAAVDHVEVELEGGAVGIVAAEDEDPVDAPNPWVALLPALDATAMGWTERDWYLGEHRSALFDRSGNVGPTVWCDGRIVGGWIQREDGEVVWRLLEDVGRAAEEAVADAAAQVAKWLGAVRVIPRFRTPLEQELCR